MNTTLSRLARVLAWLGLGLFSLASYGQHEGFTLRTGVEYTTGDYGGSDDIKDLYVPITGELISGRWGFTGTVPFLSIKAPLGTQVGPMGELLPGTGNITTESGLGDIRLSLTYFDLYASPDRRFLVDITGKVKLGTADETAGLGTGETDYSVQLDAYRFFQQVTLFGNLGYKVRGQPAGVTLEDVWFVSLGGSVPVAARTRLGLVVDIRPSAYSGREDLRELSLYLSHWSRNHWRYSSYLAGGFSDSSPDMAVGLSVGYHF